MREEEYLVCADIHKYIDHLERAIRETGRDSLAGVIFAGDLETDWSKLRECAGALPLFYISGNNDAYFVRKAAEEIPAERVLEICGHRIFLTHGDRYGVPRTKRLIAAAKEKKCDIVIYGHTHQYNDTECRGVRLLNPGALMKRGEPGVSTYMILKFDASGRVNAEKKVVENTVPPS